MAEEQTHLSRYRRSLPEAQSSGEVLTEAEIARMYDAAHNFGDGLYSTSITGFIDRLIGVFPMTDTDVPLRNHLLAALPEHEYARLSAHLERVWLSPGEVLHESSRPLQNVYFPTTAIMSLLYVMEDGAAAEIAAIGNEGMVGIALVMGGDTMRNRAVALCAGTAYRLNSRLLMTEINRTGGAAYWRTATSYAALRSGIDCPDGSERRLQSASCDGTAAVPLAVVLPGSLAFK